MGGIGAPVKGSPAVGGLAELAPRGRANTSGESTGNDSVSTGVNQWMMTQLG